MIDLNTTWFWLLGILITGYIILDGFDFGVGVLHLFARNDEERRIHINAIGPVWDGNGVWLITASAALFGTFPRVYATVFSSFYHAFVLLLAALIARAVSMEFRGKVDSPKWRRIWDWSFGLGSLLPAFLFGIAFGNILRGIPIERNGMFTGSFIGLLNPYALLIGLLSLLLFTMHGALYMNLKTGGTIRERMVQYAKRTWVITVLLIVVSTVATVFTAPYLYSRILSNPFFWIFLVILSSSILYIPIALRAAKRFHAFLASSAVVGSLFGIASASLFPRLVPSRVDLDFSLTIYNASSTPRTLTVMLVIVLIGMPFVIGYTVYIYRVFKGKVVITESSY